LSQLTSDIGKADWENPWERFTDVKDMDNEPRAGERDWDAGPALTAGIGDEIPEGRGPQ